MDSTPRIRQPGVSGLFYPRDADELRATVDDLFARNSRHADVDRVYGLLAPHAGYPYSGATAANAFQYLDSQVVTTVVIVGPSHVEPFNFTSVFSGDAYDTPLGRVRVDVDMTAAIARCGDSIKLSPAGHHQEHLSRAEHALEVELPFLQRVCADAAIVPIIMGNQDWHHCLALGEAIAHSRDDATVVVASSDLSHFYQDTRARELDAEFCRVFQTGDARALHDAVRHGQCEACGVGPVSAMLLATTDASIRCCDILEQTNSAAVTHDRSSVVGYAAALVSAGRENS